MPSDPRDYKLDVAGLTGGTVPGDQPYIGVRLACCGAQARIYRAVEGTHYAGRCPKCGRAVRFVVGRDGTEARFVEVD